MVIVDNLLKFKNLDKNETHLRLERFNVIHVILSQNITHLYIGNDDFFRNNETFKKKISQNITHLFISKHHRSFKKLPQNITHLKIYTNNKYKIPKNVTHLYICDCINVKIPKNVTHFNIEHKPFISRNVINVKYKLTQNIIHLTIANDNFTKIKLTQNIIILNLPYYEHMQYCKNKIIISNNIINITYGYMNGTKHLPSIANFIDKKHNNLSSQKKSIKVPYLKIYNNLIISLYIYNIFGQ